MYEAIEQYPLEFRSDMEHLLQIEGGVADRPKSHDPGGYTMYGITLASFNRYRKMRGEPRVNKEGMYSLVHNNLPVVYDFYYLLYWKKIQGASLPPSLRYVLFDIHVLEGVRGIQRLQGLLGLRQDGAVGPRTIEALKKRTAEGLFTFEETVDKITRMRMTHLQSRAHWQHNAKGWTRRVQEAAQRAYLTQRNQLTTRKPRSPILQDNNTKDTDMNKSKPVLASKTIWAGIAQVAVAVLGFLGIDIAPGDAEVALGFVESIVIAITGLLTLFGRYTAKTTLR